MTQSSSTSVTDAGKNRKTESLAPDTNPKRKRETQQDIEVIDLCGDDDDTDAPKEPKTTAKRTRIAEPEPELAASDETSARLDGLPGVDAATNNMADEVHDYCSQFPASQFPANWEISPEFAQTYYALAPLYDPNLPTDGVTAPPSHMAPSMLYEQTSPSYQPNSPTYYPTSTIDEAAASTGYEFTSPFCQPTSPTHETTSPTYQPTSPRYPTSELESGPHGYIVESPQSPVGVENGQIIESPRSPVDHPSSSSATMGSEEDPVDLTQDSPTIQPRSLPTPDPTPQKQKSRVHYQPQTIPTPKPISLQKLAEQSKNLHKLPELADRYMRKTSTAEGVEYRNPNTFSLKPPFWNKWSGKEYVDFAEHLRAQFDPTPFAQASGRSVEEIQHMFTVLVANPLYQAKEAKKRGEEGMQGIMQMFQGKEATPMRAWGKRGADKRAVGELTGVGPGFVMLITPDGFKTSFAAQDLGQADESYLQDTLTEEDKSVLFCCEE